MKKKSLLITAIAIFCFTIISMAQTVPSYVPTSGLVGWWPFTGNANDSSGNGNNGTVTGATLTSDRFGNANQAFNFDGLDDYISATPTLPTGYAPRTVSCWFKTIAGLIPTSDHPVLQSITGWGNPFSGAVIFPQMVIAPAGKAYFESGSSGNQLFSQNAVNDGVWHQIVTTYDGSSSRVKMYIDKTLQDSSALVSLGTASSFFGIGKVSWCNDPFQGQIDDVGLWDRALTKQEIIDLYIFCHISISTQPLSQSASISNNVQFTTSSDSSATYQWQTDLGVGFQNINSVGQYSGTTNDTLSVSNVTMGNNNQPFRCIIRSGSCYDTSDIAVLNVCGAVTTSPANQNVVINNTAQFTTASTDPMATYQWQSDLGVGFQNLNSVGQYSGTNKDTLRVANVTMGNNNQPFRCIVSSGACSDTSSAAVLTVMNANGINETATNNLFTVYPNPAKSQINVKADATLIGSSYTVYNNIGKVTLTGKINAENTVLDLGHLSSGVYLFSIGDSLKQKFTVVKE
jgi:hypothetical protein